MNTIWILIFFFTGLNDPRNVSFSGFKIIDSYSTKDACIETMGHMEEKGIGFGACVEGVR